ncbi:hypothetical protein WDW37_09400 [Bdellovibrionota bacterium FG-1]
MVNREEYLQSLDSQHEALADECADFLQHLSGQQGLEELAELFSTHRDEVIQTLKADRSHLKMIASFYAALGQVVAFPEIRNEPSMIMNAGSALNLLAVRPPFQSADLSKQCLILAGGALNVLAERWVRSIQHQVEPLVTLLQNISNCLKANYTDKTRVIIVEFPLGNSIPTKLLEEVMKQDGLAYHHIRVSLNRNNSKSVGITREQLMSEKLDALNLQKDDIIMHLDEWISGSNFKTVTSKLAKFAKKKGGARLLPVAMLAGGAISNAEFQNYCNKHDALLREFGWNDFGCRQLFPTLSRPGLYTEQHFFWSEHDRLAGYRKMQHLGSLLGSIVGVVEEMRADPTQFVAMHRCFMEEMAKTEAIDEKTWQKMMENPRDQRVLVELNYPDFLRWKDYAATLDFESNHGNVDDALSSLNDVSKRLLESAKGRPALGIVNFAMLWIRTAEVDPRNPYFIEGHVPVISELPEHLNALAQTFYAELRRDVLRRTVR